MALSKAQRITILLVIDTLFFMLEIGTGYAIHSLALIADGYHMLNDVLSLCVGLWAVKVAKRQGSKRYTYGWQRAETLGALVNGIFLVALCVTIALDAFSRFYEPEMISAPQVMLIVGCLGLSSNILGLLLFHDHSHSHGSGGHSHGAAEEAADEVEAAEQGHSHAHDHQHSHEHASTSEATNSHQRRIRHAHSRSLSRVYSPGANDIPTNPHAIRNSIVYKSHVPRPDSDVDDEEDRDEAVVEEHDLDTHETEDQTSRPLLNGKNVASYGTAASGKAVDHKDHYHAQPKEKSKGHSHSDLNVRGIFLHVLGDALGNMGVITTALILWRTEYSQYSWQVYVDPATSLLITCIILCSAIPLCKAASRILLQAVPDDIDVEEIRADILSLPEVIGVHHLHVWQLSDTKKVASLHVQVEFEFQGQDSARYMSLAQEINNCLHAYGIHSSTIQPEFCLDPEHDHKPLQEGEGGYESNPATPGKRSKAGSRLPSKPGSMHEHQCLLGCAVEGCSGKSCCPPPETTEDGDGHDHHSH